ncbi:GSCOCG00009744001-RA-CDS [Cotesia congregata]|nr:GSCOCG00009744001-RA-CDS [Cotesia congregata]
MKELGGVEKRPEGLRKRGGEEDTELDSEPSDEESLQEQYGRWIMGVGKQVPGYIVREELKLEKMRVKSGYRAIRFEEKVRMGTERELLKKCVEERGGKNWRDKRWDEGRDRYMKRCGWSNTGLEVEWSRGVMRGLEMKNRDRDIQKQEKRAKIRTSRFNSRFEEFMTEREPEYWGERARWKTIERKMIARLRCKSEWRGNWYWMVDEERKCRLCGKEMETLEHVARRYRKMRGWEESWEELLRQKGKGVEWMAEWLKRIEERERKE